MDYIQYADELSRLLNLKEDSLKNLSISAHDSGRINNIKMNIDNMRSGAFLNNSAREFKLLKKEIEVLPVDELLNANELPEYYE